MGYGSPINRCNDQIVACFFLSPTSATTSNTLTSSINPPVYLAHNHLGLLRSPCCGPPCPSSHSPPLPKVCLYPAFTSALTLFCIALPPLHPLTRLPFISPSHCCCVCHPQPYGDSTPLVICPYRQQADYPAAISILYPRTDSTWFKNDTVALNWTQSNPAEDTYFFRTILSNADTSFYGQNQSIADQSASLSISACRGVWASCRSW
jgi:hypothetical protein